MTPCFQQWNHRQGSTPLNGGGRGGKVLEELQETVTRLVVFTQNTQVYLIGGSHDVFVALALAQEEIASVLISVVSDEENDTVVSGEGHSMPTTHRLASC